MQVKKIAWSPLIKFLLFIQANGDETSVGLQDEQKALYVFTDTQSQTLCAVVFNKEMDIAYMYNR